MCSTHALLRCLESALRLMSLVELTFSLSICKVSRSELETIEMS